MRIDTMTYFSSGLAGIRDNQLAISRLNQQIASGKALLAPKDDPLATEKILGLSNRVAVRTQFAANQDRAELALKYETTVVEEIDKAFQQARGLLAGVNPSNDATLRNSHAEQLKGVFNHLVGLLNTRDPGGSFIFAGFDTANAPYANAGGGVATVYTGTPAPGGTRAIEVDTGRTVQVNDNLDTVFQSGVAGNDLLQELGQAIVDLPGATLTQADVDGYVNLFDTAVRNLRLIEHRLAGALTEVEDVRGTTQSLLLEERNALGELQQVDQAAAIVELQSRQTTLEAAERAYARTAGLSLFDFLS